jgi:hypothetical protein
MPAISKSTIGIGDQKIVASVILSEAAVDSRKDYDLPPI